jgi:hypothetical protein
LASQCLYRRVLGPRFEALPAVLKRFHETPGGGKARGRFRVERGAGAIRNGLASLCHMPPATDDVPVRLDVVVDGEREHWRRYFGDHCLASVQWAQGELLMESFGAGAFASAIAIEGSRMRYDVRRTWLAGAPIPGWSAPEIDGHVDAGETGWRVVTHFAVPILGKIVHYEGIVELE